MELPGEQNNADEAQKGYGQPNAAVERSNECRLDFGILADAFGEPINTAEYGNHDEDADCQKGCKLDQRFSRDGQHQAVLVFRGVDVTGAKQDGKGGKGDGCEKGRLAETNDFRPLLGELRVAVEQRVCRNDYCLELKSDVGQRPNDCDDRHYSGHRLALPIACGEKVGHRRDVLAFRQADDP